jgi:tRNA dimethylallyltransferase
VALHARLAELDPVAAARMEPTNRRRVVRALEVTVGSGRPFSSFGPGLEAYPPTPFVLVGVRVDAVVLDERIETRFTELLGRGFLDEVRALAARPGGVSRTAGQALGYRELLAHVRGEVPLDQAAAEAVRRTRAFARRQRAWFRRDPRICWLDPAGDVLAQLLEIWDGSARDPDPPGGRTPPSGVDGGGEVGD